MAWKWYSDGGITDDQLKEAIERLKETAWVHDTVNFPGFPSDELITRLTQSVTDGYMRIACHLQENGAVDQTFFFQKSEFLTSDLNTTVWNVSYGFAQSLLPNNADQDACRKFIRENMTPTMDDFMSSASVSYLYSVDYGTSDSANPLGRKIGRLQTLGAGDQWDTVGSPQEYVGTDSVHKYYGKPIDSKWQFSVSKIERLTN